MAVITPEWRTIPGIAEYEVSEYGDVRRAGKASGARVGQVLKPHMSKQGYLRYNLSVNDVSRKYSTHTLVARAFIGAKPAGMETCHNDGNRLNNHYTNLRYDTSAGNHADKFAHGTLQCGEKHRLARLKETDVAEIRETYKARSRTRGAIALGLKYGVSHKTIRRVIHGRAWKHSFQGEQDGKC